MILSGARGILRRIDEADETITLERRSSTQDYQYNSSESDTREWKKLIGKSVDLQLSDFMIVDISEIIKSKG
jgi:hypothetical protein